MTRPSTYVTVIRTLFGIIFVAGSFAAQESVPFTAVKSAPAAAVPAVTA